MHLHLEALEGECSHPFECFRDFRCLFAIVVISRLESKRR